MNPSLEWLLREVADSSLKVRVLELFLTHPGLSLSTFQLAFRLNISTFQAQQAVAQLAAMNALSYHSVFGYSDQCTLDESLLSDEMACGQIALLDALRHTPELIWNRS